jgi:hypothetical protein
MRNEFGGEKAPCLVFEEDDILRHPGRTRQIQYVGHGHSSHCCVVVVAVVSNFMSDGPRRRGACLPARVARHPACAAGRVNAVRDAGRRVAS